MIISLFFRHFLRLSPPSPLYAGPTAEQNTSNVTMSYTKYKCRLGDKVDSSLTGNTMNPPVAERGASVAPTGRVVVLFVTETPVRLAPSTIPYVMADPVAPATIPTWVPRAMEASVVAVALSPIATELVPPALLKYPRLTLYCPWTSIATAPTATAPVPCPELPGPAPTATAACP
jgi:hypothetical protein